MGKIVAKFDWECDGNDLPGGKYSRKHTWAFDGGITVDASSSPDIVPVPFSEANAIDPEEALVASISSCHMLWFLSIAGKRGFSVSHYSDSANGRMGKIADGKLAIVSVWLNPDIVWMGEVRPSVADIDAMHIEAHERCFIANSVNCEIKIGG